jgi:hypothetical protein
MTTGNETSTTVRIRLDAIVMDESTQIREATDPRLIQDYRRRMAAGETFPPIIVAQINASEPDRGFVLIDGWHRTGATRALGANTIEAQVLTDLHPKEYRWHAAKANQKHGKPLTRKENRQVFQAYVKAGQHKWPSRKGQAVRLKPAREMARDLGGIVSDRTIPKWMRQYFPSVYAKMKEASGFEETSNEFKRIDMDPVRAADAEAALGQFMANLRAIDDKDLQNAVLGRLAQTSRDAALFVSGTPDLPAIVPDDF